MSPCDNCPEPGVPDNVTLVNIRMSKRYNLNVVSVVEEPARISVPLAVLPSKCSNPLARAKPILVPLAVPRDAV